jgi:hypothetical protein
VGRGAAFGLARIEPWEGFDFDFWSVFMIPPREIRAQGCPATPPKEMARLHNPSENTLGLQCRQFLYQPPEGGIADGARSCRRGVQSTANEPTSRALVITFRSNVGLVAHVVHTHWAWRFASTSPPVPTPVLFLSPGNLTPAAASGVSATAAVVPSLFAAATCVSFIAFGFVSLLVGFVFDFLTFFF